MRASKTVGGTTTNHIWLGGEIALDYTDNSTTLYTHGIKLLRSKTYGDVSTDISFYLYNAHGDVVALGNGNVGEGHWLTLTKRYDYDPYGNALTDNSEDPNPYRYCGEYTDFESGYVYLRNRYLDPSLGRFISEDPIVHDNMYIYCGNDPINRTDPTGECWNQSTGKWVSTYSSGYYLGYCGSCYKQETLTKEQILFIATIAGEAIGEDSKSWKAVGHVIMNRVKDTKYEWKDLKTVSAVIKQKWAFTCYTRNEPQYANSQKVFRWSCKTSHK